MRTTPGIHSEIPAMNDLKYVRLEDKILLVYAPNWIVVGEIRNERLVTTMSGLGQKLK
jgi:hypothetical protein